MPIPLPPGDEVSGHLLFEVPSYYLDKIAGYLDKIAGPGGARLELWDHVSGKRMTLPAVLGSYPRDQMTASSGGAETLGPEFGRKAITPGEAA